MDVTHRKLAEVIAIVRLLLEILDVGRLLPCRTGYAVSGPERKLL
jgi:hypothetical protein